MTPIKIIDLPKHNGKYRDKFIEMLQKESAFETKYGSIVLDFNPKYFKTANDKKKFMNDLKKAKTIQEFERLFKDGRNLKDLFIKKGSSKTIKLSDIAKRNVNVGKGMSETTLNSTITELAPCILWKLKAKTTLDPDAAYDLILKNYQKINDVYVNKNDMKSGHKYIMKFKTSSKFTEKMNNALGILKYLYTQDFDKIYWGYRAKPKGVNSNHPGDIFIIKNKFITGISLKAGSASSMEPKLNTYVKPILEYIGLSNDINTLRNELYEKVYKNIELPKDFSGQSKYIPLIQSIPDRDMYYDEVLKITRDFIIKEILKKPIEFITNVILKEQDDVPCIVVKAINKGYVILTDEDDVKKAIKNAKKSDIKIEKSQRSKQNFTIYIKKTRLEMSIRSNKSAPNNKLAQGWNLAVKFNGVKG